MSEEDKSVEVARLEELLKIKDKKLKKTKAKLQKYLNEEEEASHKEAWIWTEHQILDEDPTGLPIPRIELEWVTWDERGYNMNCWDHLVYRHFDGKIIKVPIGLTRCNGGNRMLPEQSPDGPRLSTPFRSGVDAGHLSHQLNLPLYIIANDLAQQVFWSPDRKPMEHGPIISLPVPSE